MRKKSFLVSITLIGLSSFVVLGNSPELITNLFETVQNNPITKVFSSSDEESEKLRSTTGERNLRRLSASESSATEKTAIPDYVLYESVFRRIIMFEELAKSQEEKGESITELRDYFVNEAELTSQENDLLAQTAADYTQDVKIIDAQAEIIIEQLKQQYPVSSISEGQLIQPTPELLQLQEQRNKLALHYKVKLKDLLGNDRFVEFDKFVQGRFASGFRAMPLTSISNSSGQGGKK